ncbi:protein TILLER ANGLE CONTROL 1 [Mercurialis annua]|uniref:protein TILLER ANGLE CONTROL 1 n=1 Tax=Mercurialis annua TaxID=3986 RepID=UPI00215EF233|nr:protein TILLER ANGLE CONTROL 1 [Mercurialis annua]
MKIFNWVHRQFHHAPLKDGLARNVKKAEFIKNEGDKQALLKQVALVDVLDGWRDGILTIGTLGLDPLKPFDQQNQYFVLESEHEDQYQEDDDDHNGDELEQSPVTNSSSFKQEHSNIGYESCDDDEEDEVNPLIFTRFDHNFDIGSTLDIKSESDDIKEKGKRITLAELFLEDSDVKKKKDSVQTDQHIKPGKKSTVPKTGLSFAKKLIPSVGDDSRPIKKLNKLMKRMLKRKIHPDVEGKDNDQQKSSIMEFAVTKGNVAAESVSLLPTPSGLTI